MSARTPRFSLPALAELPPLKGRSSLWRKLSTLIVVIGVTIGLFGAVRTSGILVAIGCALYAYNSYTTTEAKRKVELIIPAMVSLLLLVVSLALPHAK